MAGVGIVICPSIPAAAKPRTACITVSQNMMQPILAVRVSDLVVIAVSAKKIALPAAAIIPRLIGAAPGTGDQQNSGKSNKGRDHTRGCKPFTEQQWREQNNPKRLGEFQRKNLRQRNDTYRIKPQVLTREMHNIPDALQTDATRVHLRPVSRCRQYQRNNEDPHDASKQHDFERVMSDA